MERLVPAPIVRSDTFDADSRLSDLALGRAALLEVLAVAFAEHGNCNENDPAGSRGLAVYRWCVRGLREQYRSAGWDLDRSGGIETIVHHEKKIRIAVINTDAATCKPGVIPQNSSRKGPNSERAAATNAQMFPGAEAWPVVAKTVALSSPTTTRPGTCAFISTATLCGRSSRCSWISPPATSATLTSVFSS